MTSARRRPMPRRRQPMRRRAGSTREFEALQRMPEFVEDTPAGLAAVGLLLNFIELRIQRFVTILCSITEHLGQLQFTARAVNQAVQFRLVHVFAVAPGGQGVRDSKHSLGTNFRKWNDVGLDYQRTNCRVKRSLGFLYPAGIHEGSYCSDRWRVSGPRDLGNVYVTFTCQFLYPPAPF